MDLTFASASPTSSDSGGTIGILIIIVLIVVVAIIIFVIVSAHLRRRHHHLQQKLAESPRSELEVNREKLIQAGYNKLDHSFDDVALGTRLPPSPETGEERDGFLKIEPEGHLLTVDPATHFSYDHLSGKLTAHDLERNVKGSLRHLGSTIVPDSTTEGRFELYQRDDDLVILSEQGSFIGTGENTEPGRFRLLRRKS